jgi:hypothetical protein
LAHAAGFDQTTPERLSCVRDQTGATRVFTGTYTDESAEDDGMALAGKRAIRFKSKLRLLIAD